MTRGKRRPDVRLRLAPGGSPTLLCGEDGAPSRLDIGQPLLSKLGTDRTVSPAGIGVASLLRIRRFHSGTGWQCGDHARSVRIVVAGR